MGINTADMSGSKTELEQNSQIAKSSGTADRDTIGINAAINIDSGSRREVMGINNTIKPGRNDSDAMGRNINTADMSGIATPKVPDVDTKRTNSDIASETMLPSTSRVELDVKPKLVLNVKSHHKRRPKSRGKHYRPQPAPPPQDIQEPPAKPKKSTKLEFVTVTHGIRKVKKKCKYKCNICSVMSDTQASANNHYRSTHPPIKCSGCTKVYNNPNSLRRHTYLHTVSIKYTCHTCGKIFPFESDLSYHRLKHRRNPGFMCNHEVNGGICGKWFFARSDLTKHTKTHSGTVYSCYECDYTTLDKRYLRAHRYTHSDKERYRCETCQKTFKHHTQLLRHRPCDS